MRLKKISILLVCMLIIGAVDDVAIAQVSSGSAVTSPAQVSSGSAVTSPAQASSGAAVTLSPTPESTGIEIPVPTPSGPVEHIIKKIEVVNTIREIAYGSTLSLDLITIKVYYYDGTSETTNPESFYGLNAFALGAQSIVVTYQNISAACEIIVVPRRVAGIKMLGGTKTTMTIGWDEQVEAEQYVIYASKQEDGVFEKIAVSKTAKYTVTGLVQGQFAYIRITAAAGELVGEISETAVIAPKPGRVSQLKANSIKKTKITLTWEDAAGATDFAVYYRTPDDTDFSLVGEVKATVLNAKGKHFYKIEGLDAGRDYCFKVCAYALDFVNLGDGVISKEYGTAPKLPVISEVKGGHHRVKVYWKTARGAQRYDVYISKNKDSGYKAAKTVSCDEYQICALNGLRQNKKYYVKVAAVRDKAGFHLVSKSAVWSAVTRKVRRTSTKAKYYKTKKALKKSNSFELYETFAKKMNYKKSIIAPGIINTNVGGMNCRDMMTQGITFAGKYLLITAYDFKKAQESVIYIVDKKTKKYITTLVLPIKSHLGGIAYDGSNIWIPYGNKLYSFKFAEIRKAVSSHKPFYEINRLSSATPLANICSYLLYYKKMLWAGTYSEFKKKHMVGFKIQNKSGTPSLVKASKILMPSKVQGVAVSAKGEMVLSRSCMFKKELPGFMSRIQSHKPKWNKAKKTFKLGKARQITELPPMNEGIAMNGAYTYVIYESACYSRCEYKIDRVTAFKTKDIY